MSEEQLPDDVQDLVNRIFGLARDPKSGDDALAAAHLLASYIDAGVDVNLSNQDGNSLLMLAAYSGNLAILDILIDKGADPNQLNARQQSPLAGAIFKKEDAVIDRLMAAQADPYKGSPNAVETARLFGREDLLPRFEDFQN